MKLDCVRIQSHQFVQGTRYKIPEFLLLIRDDFTYDPYQKTCYLLIDEVYVKPLLQYHGGSIYGEACNGEGDLAKTVLGFMGVTLFGGPKFLYRMLPVLGLSSAFLFEQTCFILNNIRKAGGNPVAIIVDVNRINQSF